MCGSRDDRGRAVVCSCPLPGDAGTARRGLLRCDRPRRTIIDGTPLFKILGDRYPGVAVGLVAPPSGHWLGDIRYGEDDRAVVLDGICGTAGCCGVFARIAVEDDAVVWSDFVARGTPELPSRLHFEFDRATYEKAVAGLLDLQGVDWIIELDEFGEEP